jgi:XRE family transcriptional regulator, master regulator for biofilm formation
MTVIGKAIRTERKYRGISQVECARRAGLAKSYLSGLETGAKKDPGLQTLLKVAKGLRARLIICFG